MWKNDNNKIIFLNLNKLIVDNAKLIVIKDDIHTVKVD